MNLPPPSPKYRAKTCTEQEDQQIHNTWQATPMAPLPLSTDPGPRPAAALLREGGASRAAADHRLSRPKPVHLACGPGR